LPFSSSTPLPTPLHYFAPLCTTLHGILILGSGAAAPAAAGGAAAGGAVAAEETKEEEKKEEEKEESDEDVWAPLLTDNV
jgi:60s Acidic ribosomal protein